MLFLKHNQSWIIFLCSLECLNSIKAITEIWPFNSNSIGSDANNEGEEPEEWLFFFLYLGAFARRENERESGEGVGPQQMPTEEEEEEEGVCVHHILNRTLKMIGR